MKLQIINGPNLNLLGYREPKIYGNETFDDVFSGFRKEYSQVELFFFQSNSEHEIIEKLHETGFHFDGIILNAGAYTHTSVGIADAISSIQTPVIEVHISNLLKREGFRHISLIGPYCIGSIMGFGMDSYRLAIEHFANKERS